MIVITVPILVVLGVLAFFGTKAVIAENTYNKALTALNKNDAKNTYNLLVLATNENPYVDRYHASLAQVDMALAISLASNKNLTDADKNNVTQFVQQAINEGKAEVALNPGRSGNWEILGQIYQKLVTYAQGSDQFAIQAFFQSVALDPGNPSTRIELGEIYLTTGDYKDAIDAFKLAIAVKPDLANAHYNLALAYQGNSDYTDAVSEINNVISLVAKGSDDYNLAETTLTNLQKLEAPVSK
jgi:tetratricopeptide (TPR) repeat protein